MDILNLAIYTLPPYVVALFALGAACRVSRYIFLSRRAPVKRRSRPASKLLIGLVKTFLDPLIIGARLRKPEFISGLMMLHILGVIPLIFLLGQHVAMFSYWFPPYSVLQPLSIPSSATSSALTLTAPVRPASEMAWSFVGSVWGPLTIVLNGDLLAILAMLGVAYKLGDKVWRAYKRMIHIRPGDFAALLLLLAILVTGFMATHHLPSGDIVTYRLVLGTHIILAEILVVILPFTKFWHFVFGYWYGKLHEWYDLKYRRGAL